MPYTRLVPPERVPIGTASLPPRWAECEDFSIPHTPTESARSYDYSQAHINAYGRGSDAGGRSSGARHLFNQAVKGDAVPRFSGNYADWQDFARKWQHYLKMVHADGTGPLPEALVLNALEGRLDRASAALLATRRMENPGLSYHQFWHELESRFVRDVQALHRQNWHKLAVEKRGHTPTVLEWTEFMALYQGRRALVENWGEEEDRELVYAQLTQELCKEALKERAKRRLGKKWVRVSVPAGSTIGEVRREMEAAVGTHLRLASQDRHNFVVDCADDLQMRALLDWDGAKLDGRTVRVSRAQYDFNGDDLLEFVRGILETEDEVRQRRTNSPPKPTYGDRGRTAVYTNTGGKKVVVVVSPITEGSLPRRIPKNCQDPPRLVDLRPRTR